MSAYHFKYFQNIQFKNHGIAPAPPDLPTLKAYPTPGVGGRFGFFSLKWRERINLKVPGAILALGCAILSTRAKTVRGVGTTPLRRTRVNSSLHRTTINPVIITIKGSLGCLAPTFYMSFINVTEDLSHSDYYNHLGSAKEELLVLKP